MKNTYEAKEYSRDFYYILDMVSCINLDIERIEDAFNSNKRIGINNTSIIPISGNKIHIQYFCGGTDPVSSFIIKFEDFKTIFTSNIEENEDYDGDENLDQFFFEDHIIDIVEDCEKNLKFYDKSDSKRYDETVSQHKTPTSHAVHKAINPS